MASTRLYFTLFKTDGEVTQLPRKPTPKMIHEILDCENVEEITMGIKYNGKDHHEGTLLIDDLGVNKKKSVNTVLNRALNESLFWRNREYIICNKEIVVYGDAIMVTKDSLINPDMSVDSTVERDTRNDEIWKHASPVTEMLNQLKLRNFLNGGGDWMMIGSENDPFTI